MAQQRQVAVSYPADSGIASILTGVLDGVASVSFLDQLPGGDRVAALHQAEVLFGLNLRRELPDGALRDAPALRFVQLLSAGADSVDFAAIPAGVTVAGNVGAYAEPIAEHVMAMVLSLAKHLPAGHAALARGVFDRDTMSLSLRGAVCAIVGFGGIGQATARLMRPFGARIHAVNSSGQTTEPVEWAGTLGDLDEVLAAADVLVIAIPLTAASRGLIGRRELGLMKPGAILVNVARGAIVNEQALYEHLRDNPEFSAAIDTWWNEPRGSSTDFRPGYPFFDLPNFLGSPHNSGDVPGIMRVAAARAAENMRRYLDGEPVSGIARPEDYADLR